MRTAMILAALALSLSACGSGAPQAARSSAEPPPRWPGTVAFSAERSRATGLDLYVQRPAGKSRRLTHGPGNEFSPSWAPDGTWLAYRVNPPRSDDGDIWTMRPDGSRRRNLTRSRGVADWSPSISPDGRRIAFMSGRSGTYELWVMDSDGGDPRQLTEAMQLSEYPSWSPDGRQLAFGAYRAGNFEVASIAADGSGAEHILTGHPSRDQWPAWSPDGRHIAFMSDRDGNEDILVMRPDGSGVRNLTRTDDRFETHPAWAADGRLTLYQHAEGPVHIRVDTLGEGPDHSLPIDGSFVLDWTP